MKKSQGRVTAASVVSFLVFEAQFPRSLRYCLRSALGILRQIWPERASDGLERPSTRRLEAVVRWLDDRETRLVPAQLHEVLTHIVDETTAIGSLIESEILGPPRPAPTTADAHPAQ